LDILGELGLIVLVVFGVRSLPSLLSPSLVGSSPVTNVTCGGWLWSRSWLLQAPANQENQKSDQKNNSQDNKEPPPEIVFLAFVILKFESGIAFLALLVIAALLASGDASCAQIEALEEFICTCFAFFGVVASFAAVDAFLALFVVILEETVFAFGFGWSSILGGNKCQKGKNQNEFEGFHDWR
jgi:hypothetical protein